MSDLLEGVLGQLGPGGLAQIAKGLGADESAIGSAVSAAIPAILAGMANNTRKDDGANALANALGEHNVSIFDQLGSLLGGQGDGAKILGHVLGQRQPHVEQNLSKNTGLDLGLVMKLLPILAPLVMGYLSREKEKSQLDPGGLSDLLNNERQKTEEKKPGLGGLAAILDADGDGSILDDILGKLTGN